LLPMLLGPKNKLGAAVDVSAKEAAGEPIEVRLKSTGSARLHITDARGSPFPGYMPSLELVITPGPTFREALEKGVMAGETVYLATTFEEATKSAPKKGKADGTVTIEGLIPGATYRLRGFQQPSIHKEFTAEPGKLIDVDVPVRVE